MTNLRPKNLLITFDDLPLQEAVNTLSTRQSLAVHGTTAKEVVQQWSATGINRLSTDRPSVDGEMGRFGS